MERLEEGVCEGTPEGAAYGGVEISVGVPEGCAEGHEDMVNL